jgi:hypothetical protein
MRTRSAGLVADAIGVIQAAGLDPRSPGRPPTWAGRVLPEAVAALGTAARGLALARPQVPPPQSGATWPHRDRLPRAYRRTPPPSHPRPVGRDRPHRAPDRPVRLAVDQRADPRPTTGPQPGRVIHYRPCQPTQVGVSSQISYTLDRTDPGQQVDPTRVTGEGAPRARPPSTLAATARSGMNGGGPASVGPAQSLGGASRAFTGSGSSIRSVWATDVTCRAEVIADGASRTTLIAGFPPIPFRPVHPG